jgi:gamma-glutamylcyclotransferase
VKINALRELPSASREELSALMPSILDKAFKGELLMRKVYFAYGSNMKTDRMTKRVPSAKPLSYAKLMDKKLTFNKISSDGSGKTNIVDSENNVVLGVLFEVDEKDIMKLDAIEKGYEKQDVTVLGTDGQQIHTFTYVSAQTKDGLKPYDWYLNFLIEGAEENKLPKDYVDYLRGFESVPDTRKKK